MRVSKHFFFFCSVRDRCSFSRGSHSTPASVIMAGGITHLLSRCLRLLFLLLWCQKSFCVNCYYSFRVSFTAECDTVCLMRRYFCVAVFFLHSTKEYFLEGLWSTASPFACHIAIKKKNYCHWATDACVGWPRKVSEQMREAEHKSTSGTMQLIHTAVISWKKIRFFTSCAIVTVKACTMFCMRSWLVLFGGMARVLCWEVGNPHILMHLLQRYAKERVVCKSVLCLQDIIFFPHHSSCRPLFQTSICAKYP